MANSRFRMGFIDYLVLFLIYVFELVVILAVALANAPSIPEHQIVPILTNSWLWIVGGFFMIIVMTFAVDRGMNIIFRRIVPFFVLSFAALLMLSAISPPLWKFIVEPIGAEKINMIGIGVTVLSLGLMFYDKFNNPHNP